MNWIAGEMNKEWEVIKDWKNIYKFIEISVEIHNRNLTWLSTIVLFVV